MNNFLFACMVCLGLVQAEKVSAQSQLVADTAELHCLQLPLSLAMRTHAATLIIEARAGSTKSNWDTNHQRIYTQQSLRILRILKGTPTNTEALSLLLEGGRVDLDQQVLTNTLQPLANGQQGIFFLVPAPGSSKTNAVYIPYGSAQGLIASNVIAGTAADPFQSYTSIAEAADEIEQILESTSKNEQDSVSKNNHTGQIKKESIIKRTTAVTITSFSPTTLAAGVGTVLTIQGTGFGASQGSGNVSFKNADNGGITTDTPRPADYLSWSDSQIRVRVPSLCSNGHPAGTGIIRVISDVGTTAASDVPLTVLYALTNIESTTATVIERPNHIVANSTGGLTFHFSPNFQSSAAKAPWLRALKQWRCSTGINWNLGTEAATNVIAGDGQSVVAFNSGSDLPVGIIGRTTTYYKGCYDQQGNTVFYTQEIDQEFASPDAFSFQYGPTLATGQQVDFESVVVHELGHAQQLSHIIQPGAVMHYAVSRGQNLRTLSVTSDISGGRLVLRSYSFRDRGCGGQALLPAPLIVLIGEPSGASFTFRTQDECFLNGFVLERSRGVDTTAWQSVVSVAAGAIDGKYHLTDSKPTTGLSYYRLGLRRPDGSTDYTIPMASDAGVVASQIFPNPVVGDQAQLSYVSTANDVVTFKVYDELGRLCHQEYATVRTGLNVLSITTSNLTTGLYLLRLTTQQGISQSLRLVRM